MPFYCKGQGHPEKCTCPIGNPEPHAYNPFHMNGTPKLSLRRSEFERNGWLILSQIRIQTGVLGTIVRGVALDSPTEIGFGFLTKIPKDPSLVYLFRKVIGGRIQLMCLPFENANGPEDIHEGFDDCFTELELSAK